MAIIESAGLSDVGRKRTTNEDALLLDDQQRLYVVADGMGGHRAGEVASAMVLDSISRHMQDTNPRQGSDLSPQLDKNHSSQAQHLLSGIYKANHKVYSSACNHPEYHGMGSTVAMAYFTDNTLIVANVGDSPIYLIHEGRIEMLSVVHNVITEQSAIDPDAELRIGDEYRYMLTRAIGAEATVRPDACEMPYFDRDIVVLGSDGLTDKVSQDEILQVVQQKGLQPACRQLVNMANDRGGDDNITVALLRVRPTGFSMARAFRSLRDMLWRKPKPSN